MLAQFVECLNSEMLEGVCLDESIAFEYPVLVELSALAANAVVNPGNNCTVNHGK